MLATASGDQTIRVWDMRPQQPEAVATLRGHKGSVKAVEFRPHSRNQLVSGARGGDVILWDTRTSSGQAMSVLNVKPLQQIANAHVRDWPRSGSAVAGGRGSSASKGAMGGASRGKKSTQGPPSVTSVVFIDEYVLASAGANDGAVKLWDLRKAWNSEVSPPPSSRPSPQSCPHALPALHAWHAAIVDALGELFWRGLADASGCGGQGKSTPCRSFMTREASATGRARGITALAVSHTSSKLLASSADHHIYMFDCIVPEREAVMFSGHVNSSFYVKSTFSPDARFILSGSTDNHVYIWDVANPLIPPLRLKGHSGEVSDVAWSPTDFWKLASSSDDTTVRVWTVDRALNDHQRQHAHAFRDETETGRAANTFADVGEQILYDGFAASRVAARPAPFSTGAAEVPRCWSQPLVQSEEDRLTCQETMMFSDMLLSPAEGGAWGESGEHAPIWCEDRRSMTRRLSAQLDASQAASQPEVASHTGLSGSPMGLPSRRSPSGSPWMPGVMEGEVNGGAGSGGAAATTPTTVSRAVRVRSMRSPSLKQPRLTDYFKQHDGTSSPRADSPLLSPRRLSPVDATGSGGGGASGEGSSCLESDAVLAAARPDSGERERAAEQGNGGMGGGDEGVVTPHTAVKRARHTAHIS